VSNFLAIATVTATLSRAIQATAGADVPGATVTTLRPESPGNGTPQVGVNIYLYQVLPNPTWRNTDLPTRDPGGRLVQRPQAALDLHYLLSFYGNEAQMEPQRLLGSVVRLLHVQPALTRQMIRDTIADPSYSFLAASDLADAIELVRFTPMAMSLEDLSKLWSVFFQVPYTLSVVYQASVVLIEPEITPRQALPVRERNVSVMPFRQPVIEQVVPAAGPGEPILAGSTIALQGRCLRGDVTRVRVGGIELTPAPADLSDTRIIVPLPAGLLAGVQAAQVIHLWLIGTPPTPHHGVESNVAPFVLQPVIRQVGGGYQITLTNVVTAADGTRSADVSVTLDPAVGRRQRVMLLLNEFNPPADRSAFAYSFAAPSRDRPGEPERADTIVIPVRGVAPGQYLVRVQVDGAQSPLEVDTTAGSPTFGQFVRPTLTI